MRTFNVVLVIAVLITITLVFLMTYSVVAMQGDLKKIQLEIAEEERLIRMWDAERSGVKGGSRLTLLAKSVEMVRASSDRIIEADQIGFRTQLELYQNPIPIILPSGSEIVFLAKPLATFKIPENSGDLP